MFVVIILPRFHQKIRFTSKDKQKAKNFRPAVLKEVCLVLSCQSRGFFHVFFFPFLWCFILSILDVLVVIIFIEEY